jgi:hypothetical protein
MAPLHALIERLQKEKAAAQAEVKAERERALAARAENFALQEKLAQLEARQWREKSANAERLSSPSRPEMT